MAEDSFLVMEPRDEYDPCIVGVVRRKGWEDIVCYDALKVVKVLEGHGMEEEDAWEFFNFNVLDAHMGPGTPCFIYPPGE